MTTDTQLLAMARYAALALSMHLCSPVIHARVQYKQRQIATNTLSRDSTGQPKFTYLAILACPTTNKGASLAKYIKTVATGIGVAV
jgi:hypothetical protein